MRLLVDRRFGNVPRYRLTDSEDDLMLVPDEIRKCVAFIGYDGSDGRRRMAGTGFFVQVPSERLREKFFRYLVTARHIIEKISQKSIDGNVLIRLNLKQGDAEWISTKLDQWVTHQDDPFVDVAAIYTPGELRERFDYGHLGMEMFLDEKKRQEVGIGLGDEIIVTGLFSKQYGQQRNMPIVRVGHIAAFPDEKVTVNMFGNKVNIDACLVETRSIGGLSGSPVFVNIGYFRVARGKAVTYSHHVMYFLGLIHGHWQIGLDRLDIVTEDDDERESFNMGIAVVVPSTKIHEVLFHHRFVEERRLAEELFIERDLPVADTEESGGTDVSVALPPDATVEAENPQHREDFNRLLTAAVKGKPSGG